MIRERDKKAFKEVYVILKYLEENELKKIPLDIIEALEDNMDYNYEYEMNDDINLEKQELLPETKAILFNLFRDYLSEPWQKEKIIKMQNEERKKNDLNKQKKYNIDVFKKKQKKKIEQTQKQPVELVKYKENIFKKILDKIKKLFL